MHKKGMEQETQILQMFIHALIGVLVGFAVCIVCLMVFSLAVANGILPESQMKALTLVACVLSGGAGGWIAARKSKTARLLIGFMAGGGLFLMIITIGCLVYHSIGVEQDGLLLLGSCLCGGALSGILAGQGRGKRRAKAGKKKRR